MTTTIGPRARVGSARPPSLSGLLVAILLASAVGPHGAAAESVDYTVTGIDAWSVAKTNGFSFRPLTFASGQTVTTPWDGVNTRLQTQERDLLGNLKTITLAQVVGGNSSVNRPASGTRTVTFELFGSRTLAPGWTVKEVRLTGNFIWDRRVTPGSSDMSVRIKGSSTNVTTGSASLNTVILSGPAGADWRDAFVGRKLFTITGIQAWSEAKEAGFTFLPILDGFQPEEWKADLSAPPPHDGVDSKLIGRFNWAFSVCRDGCVTAHVVGGNMIVPKPSYSSASRVTARFWMFGKKRLRAGWVVKSVSMSGGTWIRRPSDGSDDLLTIVEVTGRDTQAGSAYITSITLEGPSTASGWQDAFKVP